MSRTKKLSLVALAFLLVAGGAAAASSAPEPASMQAHEFVCC